jgi:hypothetical protein
MVGATINVGFGQMKRRFPLNGCMVDGSIPSLSSVSPVLAQQYHPTFCFIPQHATIITLYLTDLA